MEQQFQLRKWGKEGMAMELAISLTALGISILTFILDTKYRYKQETKNKILRYILQYYSPTYIFTQLPTTQMIVDHFSHKWLKGRKKFIISLLLELNLEEKIQIFSCIDTSFDELRWAPKLNTHNN